MPRSTILAVATVDMGKNTTLSLVQRGRRLDSLPPRSFCPPRAVRLPRPRGFGSLSRPAQ